MENKQSVERSGVFGELSRVVPTEGIGDEELMELVALDQNIPFEKIVRRYQNRLLASAYRSLRNYATAEDIVQDTLTEVWQSRRQFNKNIAKFSTWVYTILRNHIGDYFKDSRKIRQVVSLSAVEEDKDILIIARGRETEAWFETLSEDRLAKLKEIVLQHLTKQEQQLYRLKEEEGLSCEEISRIPPFKGMKAATLQKRRQRYKDKIIEVLETEKYDKSGRLENK